MGFTAVKNTVCHSLLEFCPPGIKAEFVMECTLTARPTIETFYHWDFFHWDFGFLIHFSHSAA